MTIAEILKQSVKAPERQSEDGSEGKPESTLHQSGIGTGGGTRVAGEGGVQIVTGPTALPREAAPQPPAPSTAIAVTSPATPPSVTESAVGAESADWFEALSAKRRGWWESTQANNYERGIRQSTVEKYADPVHFLYELLQNAEDQGATQALFALDKTKLRFIHNGESFTPQDVENITGLGNSDKPEQANKIGRFGIGFKSVFTVTARPRIYTFLSNAPFAFAIENLVVPVRIEDKNATCKDGQTQFSLPFDDGSLTDTYQRIRQRLQTLEVDTLLFLKKLRRIHWTTDDGQEGILTAKREEKGRLIQLTAEVGPKGRPVKQPEVDYLVYTKEVTAVQSADRRLSVSIAYRRERGKIVTEKGQATANVYFPTREKTGLKFRLHAPFLLNDSRANIKDNAPENTAFIRACADLFAQSLPDLKERGHLTAEVLNLLPIREADFEGSAFRPLYDAMFHTARTLEILPTQTGSTRNHVRAARAKISDSKPLKSLFGEAQLTTLYESTSRDPVCWLHESIQKTVMPDLWNYLMRALEVDEVDAMKVARRLETNFVSVQTDDWMTEFYAFLTEQPALWRVALPGRERSPLRNKPIIRLEEGTGVAGATHVAPFSEDGVPNAYLPLKTDAIGFPTVKRALVRNNEAMKFLLDLGLKQPNVVDRIAMSILPRYQQTAPSVSDQTYAFDIREIADAVGGLPQESTERRELCRKLLTLNIVRAVRADNPKMVGCKKPTEVYARTAENVEWFAGNGTVWLICPTLEKHDRWPSLQKAIATFATGTFPTLPRVSARLPDNSGYVEIVTSHGWHKRGVVGFDSEADIVGLAHALRTITPTKAKLLWRILALYSHTLTGVTESSTTKNFVSPTRTETFSLMGKACQEARWLLHKETGVFHHPAKIRLSDLPDDWDKGSAGAKEVALRLGMSNPEEQAAADKLGVPVDAFLRFAEAYKRDPRVMDQLVVRTRPDLPTSESPYTERRATKVAHEMEESPEIAYEKRERSVRTSGGGVKTEADAYLREKYTNAEGQMICQICKQEMPFDKEDGTAFFYSVPCLKEIEKEAKQNYLALCPLCAALYQFGNWGNAPGALRQAILREPGPHFTLYLTGQEETIWFHAHHLGDLKSILSVVGVSRPTKF